MNWQSIGSLENMSAQVRDGRLDPVSLTEMALQRAAEVAHLGAVVYLDADRARKDAAAVTGGRLAGIPILIKEIIAVADMPYRCGSAVFADRVASDDAKIVQDLRAEGAVVIGLCHSDEFACGCTGLSNPAGPCRNPHDEKRISGGSSSGSAAAVAAGIVPLAVGTDTAGSIRTPAALCGVVGAKPARGTLSTSGVFPLSATLDHVGLLTATVSDARYAMGITQRRGAAPRLGILTNPEPGQCLPEVLERVTSAGAALIHLTAPDWSEITATALDLQGPEIAALHWDMLAKHGADYQPDVRDRIAAYAEIPGWRYVRALASARRITFEVTELLSQVDAIILPTVPIAAPTIQQARHDPELRGLLLRNTRLANLTGHPAVSIPIAGPGLPIGLQVLAPNDASTFTVAEWLSEVINGAAPAMTID
jgi:aspartyl-tRNA(Asn)/glutamyl-tRNA(Gln) amidotransferase subunit A